MPTLTLIPPAPDPEGWQAVLPAWAVLALDKALGHAGWTWRTAYVRSWRAGTFICATFAVPGCGSVTIDIPKG